MLISKKNYINIDKCCKCETLKCFQVINFIILAAYINSCYTIRIKASIQLSVNFKKCCENTVLRTMELDVRADAINQLIDFSEFVSIN